MFAKALTTALVSATLLAGAFQTSASASGCGGGEGGEAASIMPIHKHKKLPSASSTDRKTGFTTTSRGNADGSRTITVTERDGRVIRTERVEGPQKKADRKNKKAKKPGRPWASAYDPATGTRTTSVGLNQRGSVRAVVSVGPFGIGFGFSR